MTIRTLRAGEANRVLSLWAAAGATPSITDTVEDVEAAIAADHLVCFVAELGGEIVGSVMAGFDGWRGSIYRLAVHPGHRRQGIARQLVAAAEEVFAAWGVRRVTALVEKDHAEAVSFWKAVGYGDDTRIARFIRNPTGAKVC